MSECPICDHDHYAVCMARVTAGGVEVSCGCRDVRERPRLHGVRPARVEVFPPPATRGRVVKRSAIGVAGALGLVALGSPAAALGLTVGLVIAAAVVGFVWLVGKVSVERNLFAARDLVIDDTPVERMMVGVLHTLMLVIWIVIAATLLFGLTALGMWLTGAA